MGTRHRWLPCGVLLVVHLGAVPAVGQQGPVELAVEIRDLARVP